MTIPNLRNYTTTVSAERSIAEIESLLAKFGASELHKKVDNGICTELYFVIDIKKNGNIVNKLPFKLPANTDKVAQYLINKDKKARKYEQSEFIRNKIREQSYKVTWRIIRDWVHAQLSIIQTEMVEVEQIFLPYMMMDSNNTLYDKVISGSLKLLPEYKSEE